MRACTCLCVFKKVLMIIERLNCLCNPLCSTSLTLYSLRLLKDCCNAVFSLPCPFWLLNARPFAEKGHVLNNVKHIMFYDHRNPTDLCSISVPFLMMSLATTMQLCLRVWGNQGQVLQLGWQNSRTSKRTAKQLHKNNTNPCYSKELFMLIIWLWLVWCLRRGLPK